MKHGAESYFFDKEGWVKGALFPVEALLRIFKKFCPWFVVPKPDPIDRPDDEQPAKPRRKFCRLFERGDQPDAEGLVELGMAMETETTMNIDSSGDTDIPAGYTYLGQFIDHDITSDPTPLTQMGAVDPEGIDIMRSPALDLDSLYGLGPQQSPMLYEEDGVHLKVGLTSATEEGEPGGPIVGGFPNDLPRDIMKKAIIGDGRNDENLAVAQTHLAFIKFHNKQADEIAVKHPELTGEALFKAAREQVILHYQSIVLTDFLPRLVEPEVLQDVLANGRKLYRDEHRHCMPIEFSVGAYRLGHSLVRPVYEWNKVFNSSAVPATFELLFEFSEVSGTRGDGDDPFFGKPTLPSNWIIDWTRFYDFAEVAGIVSHEDLNFTRKIDTKLSFALKTLPEFQKTNVPPVFISLATRNLLRGRLVSLPSGQEVANAMQAAGIAIDPIADDDILGEPMTRYLMLTVFIVRRRYGITYCGKPRSGMTAIVWGRWAAEYWPKSLSV
nr:heme peroxidase family protein [Methylomarinum sp. Ch1-1]MDP4522304.1 heme peroxidase family protein [Methylomarinum sp. Ch1-1]